MLLAHGWLESSEIASHISSNDFQQQVQDNGEGESFQQMVVEQPVNNIGEFSTSTSHETKKITQTDHRLKPKS